MAGRLGSRNFIADGSADRFRFFHSAHFAWDRDVHLHQQGFGSD
jgi:hypothetical protein